MILQGEIDPEDEFNHNIKQYYNALTDIQTRVGENIAVNASSDKYLYDLTMYELCTIESFN